MTRLYISPNDQLAMFRGAKPAPESYANRGMDFEGSLAALHDLYERRSLACIAKQHVPALPVKDGKWAKVIGRATVDYTGVLKGGRFVAFDAKDCAGKRIDLSRLADHQAEYLLDVDGLGGIAFVLVRFERRREYVIPAEAWRWAQEAHLAGQIIRVPDMNWTATGKASINESELPAAWSVNHSEGWISAVSEVWTP